MLYSYARMSTDIKIAHNKPDILVIDKKNDVAIIIEMDITN